MKGTKKILLLLAAALLAMTGCGTEESSVSSSAANAGSGAAAASPVTGSSVESGMSELQIGSSAEESSTDYETADIVSIEETGRADTDDGEVAVSYKITNNGENPLTYFSLNVVYRDTNGTSICDDVLYTDVELEKGKSAYMRSVSTASENGSSGDEIEDVVVRSYEYMTGSEDYTLDLTNKTAASYSVSEQSDAKQKDVDILSFKTSDDGDPSRVTVTVTNKGREQVTDCNMNIAYYDKNGDLLYTDGQYVEDALGKGESAEITSECMDFSDQAAACEVYEYGYTLKDKDERGYRHYDINLQTGLVTGSAPEE